MAQYEIKMKIEGSRLATIQKQAEQAFGEKVSVVKREIGTSRAARFDEALNCVSDAKSQMEELRDELQNWIDGLPENLQSGTKADELQTAVDELETAISSLEEVEGASVEFPGMY